MKGSDSLTTGWGFHMDLLKKSRINLIKNCPVLFCLIQCTPVPQKQCTLNQALIQDRRNPSLSLLAASQTKDKEALTEEGVTRVIQELQQNFAYIVCDSPAGIESG